jgi:hypothetical protein
MNFDMSHFRSDGSLVFTAIIPGMFKLLLIAYRKQTAMTTAMQSKTYFRMIWRSGPIQLAFTLTLTYRTKMMAVRRTKK